MKNDLRNGCWYVYRYRIMSARLKELVLSAPYEMFFPYEYVSGYIFIHACFDQAVRFGADNNLPLWKNNRHEFVSVRDAAMRPFMRAVELRQLDIKVFDASLIDLEKDDRVVFVRGEFKGTSGYLKTLKGREGGVVVVPLTCAAGDSPTGMCYAITASPDDLAVTAFAPGNRHAKDSMRRTAASVDSAMQDYIAGIRPSDALRERFISYVRRYAGVSLETDIQRANHQLLLYRIFTLLDMDVQRSEVGECLRSQVLPAMNRRTQAAMKRGQITAQRTQSAFLASISQADAARAAHHHIA